MSKKVTTTQKCSLPAPAPVSTNKPKAAKPAKEKRLNSLVESLTRWSSAHTIQNPQNETNDVVMRQADSSPADSPKSLGLDKPSSLNTYFTPKFCEDVDMNDQSTMNQVTCYMNFMAENSPMNQTNRIEEEKKKPERQAELTRNLSEPVTSKHTEAPFVIYKDYNRNRNVSDSIERGLGTPVSEVSVTNTIMTTEGTNDIENNLNKKFCCH